MTNEPGHIDDGSGDEDIRATLGAPELGRRSGVVSAYDAEAGLGIVDGGGWRWMFHCTAIADRSRSIMVGAEVTFDVRAGGPGRFEAFHIVSTASS